MVAVVGFPRIEVADSAASTSNLCDAGAIRWLVMDPRAAQLSRAPRRAKPPGTDALVLPGVRPIGWGTRKGCLNSHQHRILPNSPAVPTGVSIRGKLQFMDYLIRAAVADAQRYQDENDPGTRIFIRQLVEMHTANLRQECQNMRLTSELCAALESMVRRGLRPDSPGETAMSSPRTTESGYVWNPRARRPDRVSTMDRSRGSRRRRLGRT